MQPERNGLSLLQLVISEPEAIDIPEAQPKQSLPYSFHVPDTRHGTTSVYPTLTQCVPAFDHHMGMFLGFCRGPSLARHACDAGTDPHVPFTFDWLIKRMVSLTMH
jgi:hypothetical protein